MIHLRMEKIYDDTNIPSNGPLLNKPFFSSFSYFLIKFLQGMKMYVTYSSLITKIGAVSIGAKVLIDLSLS